jgi:hypothetical protein
MSNITQRLFIVSVQLRAFDCQENAEKGDITTSFVPVVAKSKDEAQQKAVVWQSDNGTAVINNMLQWTCVEPSRSLSWTVIRTLPVSQDEFDTFLCLSQGFSEARVCGDTETRVEQ